MAVAKIAFQLQNTEKPTYDEIFIHMGEFHIELAFLKSIGKFIENCGLTNILVDCGLIASGSVGGFISGKSFKRCKYLHHLLNLTLEILLFERFLIETNTILSDNMKQYVSNFLNQKSENPTVDDTQLLKLLKLYDKFKSKVLTGKYGKTAQFYAMYIYTVDLFFLLNTAVRKGDLELYTYSMYHVTNFFFIFNQQNYS